MTSFSAQSGGQPSGPTGLRSNDRLDPANQSLADALRMSFRILKLLMLVLVVLYFLSGWFSVKPGEMGVILRFGRVLGAGQGEKTLSAGLDTGWHWSWPYPFERWETVSVSERTIPVEFLFELSDEERTGGIKGYKFNNLSPARDDYVITGDVNILHVSVVVRYKVSDVVAYLANVSPMPDPEATIRSPAFRRYPEYTVMTSLVRDAVIETAAFQEALHIRGAGQKEFLEIVGREVNDKLRALEAAGLSLGIEVDPTSGIISPQSGAIEAIMPPRQVQEVFDRTFAAQNEKSVAITKASSDADELLLKTAGMGYEEIAAAVQKEYDLLAAISAVEAGLPSDGGAPGNSSPADVQSLRAQLQEQRRLTENLLEQCSGEAQTVLNNAKIERDAIVKEASGDYSRFQEVLPEYLANPRIFMSRFLDDVYAKAMTNEDVAKVLVPQVAKEWRLMIPRSGKEAGEAAVKDKAREHEKKKLYGEPKPKVRR